MWILDIGYVHTLSRFGIKIMMAPYTVRILGVIQKMDQKSFREVIESRRRETFLALIGETYTVESAQEHAGAAGADRDNGAMEDEVVVIGIPKKPATENGVGATENGANAENATVLPAPAPLQPSLPFSSLTVQWLMNNYQTDKNGSIPRSTVYYHYNDHCKQHGLEPLNAASFGKLIRSVFLKIETRRLGTRGRSRYHYSGLILKPTSTLKYIDVNELPSYYGHPSRTSLNHTPNFHLDFNITKNIPRNTYKPRAPNYVRQASCQPPAHMGRLKEVFTKKRLEAMKEYYAKHGEAQPEDADKAAAAGDTEEMEEQFVVLNSLCSTDLVIETVSSLSPAEFQNNVSLIPTGNGPSAAAATKRSAPTPMQFSSLTVQWLMNNFKTDKSGSIPRSAVYFHYQEHCNFHGLEPLNAASFGKLIRSVFLGIETRRLGTRGRSRYHYSGLVLKPTSTLKFVDLNDLPSYYGHPSGISAKESQDYHLNYTRNLSLIEAAGEEKNEATA